MGRFNRTTEYVTANLATGVRREREGGREYLVAPATLVVEGVLAGSRGPLFYPAAEIERAAPLWDGMPLTLGHPTDPVANQPVPAAAVLDAVGLGVVRKPRFDRDRLRAEAWFDVQRTKAVDPTLYTSLELGRPVELSTGLRTRNVVVPRGVDRRGRAYDMLAVDYEPDHLAILPGQAGACSIDDGCGILANAAFDRGGRWVEVEPVAELTVNCAGCGSKCDAANAKKRPALGVTPEKACRIVKDGTVHGRPLTAKQRGMFGARCGQRDKANNGWVEVT